MSIIILVWILLFLLVYVRISRPPWKNLPPGPPVLPIVGSIPFLPSPYALNLFAVFNRMERIYGKIWMAKIGVNNIVVLSDIKIIQEALVKKGSVFQGRPKLYLFTDIHENAGIVATLGKTCRQSRHYLLKALKNYGGSRDALEELVREETRKLLEEIDSLSGDHLDPSMLLKKTMSNITCIFAFGERREYNDPELEEHIVKHEKLFHYLGNNSLINVYPITKYLPGDIAHSKKGLNLKNDIFSIYRRWLEKHKTRLQKQEEARDLIDAYLLDNTHPIDGQSETDSETHLLNMMNDIFIGGTDTSSSTLTWAIFYMALYPDIQLKVHQEIDSVLGPEQEVAYADKEYLPLTEACISEAVRLGSVIPLGIPHANTEDVMLNGYFIPKDSMVMLHTMSVHTNPETWPEPEKYDPNRFLNVNGQYQPKKELIPFLVGKRMCPGMKLAQMEQFLIFTSLLKRFHVQFPPGSGQHEPNGKLGVTYHPTDCTVIFQSRQDPGCSRKTQKI